MCVILGSSWPKLPTAAHDKGHEKVELALNFIQNNPGKFLNGKSLNLTGWLASSWPCRQAVWQFALSLLLLLSFTSCSVTKKSVLLDSEPGTPLEERDFRKHCDLGDETACHLTGNQASKIPNRKFPIIQGVAPSDRAVFVALHPKSVQLSWFLYNRELSQLNRLFTPKPLVRGESKWAIQRIDVRNLEPGRNYELIAGDAEGKLIERREFQPFLMELKDLRIAFVGGGINLIDQKEKDELERDLLAPQPQLIIFAGGNVNVILPDALLKASRAEVKNFMFALHVSARSTLPLAFETKLIPVTSLWNEFEYGQTFGGRSFLFRDQARETLELFFPHWADEKSIIDGPGISKAIKLKNLSLLLLDDLSFRSPKAAPSPICEKIKRKKLSVCHTPKATATDLGSRFGETQTKWIADQSQKLGKPAWLLGSGPWLKLFHPEWVAETAPDLDFKKNASAKWLAWINIGQQPTIQLKPVTFGPERK